jgi:NAD(P)-dependent dehydrogenase (short-subunit alcohol dehydrogenase family)
LVTGAASGIGFEMARQFYEAGASVYAADIDPDGAPDGTIPLQVDVTDAYAVGSAVSRAVKETGRLDVICNNAGAASTSDPISCTVEDWDRTFAVDARGVFLGTKYALPIMLSQGRGAKANTASVAGLVGLKDRTAYCASRGAVMAFTRQAAIQYAGTGVRCNSVCPGTVDSPWVSRLLAAPDDPEKARANLVARQPMGRLGDPVEIAQAALYLASEMATLHHRHRTGHRRRAAGRLMFQRRQGDLRMRLMRVGRPGAEIPVAVTDDGEHLDLRPVRRDIDGAALAQWSKGKSRETFNPLGPLLITPEDLPNPQALGLRSWVNGEVHQESSTKNTIFDIATLVYELSQVTALKPRGVVNTGTPEGVALSGRFPYLADGDIIELEIDGLGQQRRRTWAAR